MTKFDFSKKPLYKPSLVRCPFPKHGGKLWADVIEEDPKYIEWLLSGDGPELHEELYNKLTRLMEGEEE